MAMDMPVSEPSRPPEGTGQTWSIAEVERETGLGKDTLRVWERRYGFPVPLRDRLGERVYPDEQVKRLRQLKRLLDTGYRPGKVVPLPDAQLLELLSAGDPPAKTRGRRASDAGSAASATEISHWVRSLAQDRTDQVRQALQQHIVRQGLGVVVDQLVGPLCIEVGQAWMRGELSVYQEHLFTETLQSVLREAIASVDASGKSLQHRPRVLLTTTPGEQHGLGLLMAECHFALESCVRFVLGTCTPVADIAQAARNLEIDILALSFSAYASRRDIQDALRQLADALPAGVEVWVGGSAAQRHRKALDPQVLVLGAGADVATQVQRWRLAHSAGA